MRRRPVRYRVSGVARSSQRKPPRRPDEEPRRRLENWQTLLAAALAAVAAVTVALIQTSGGDSREDSPRETTLTPSTTQGPPTSPAPSVSISSVTLVSEAPPPRVQVEGSAVGLSERHEIYVIARPSTAEEISRWVASSPARASRNGSWQVDLELPPDVPMPCRFLALALEGDRASKAPNSDLVNSLVQILDKFGPDVLASSTEVVGP